MINIGRGHFLTGDCLELMKMIRDNSIDMILCDLPYGTTQNKWDSVIDFDLLWEQYWRICKGPVVLTAQCPFDKALGYSQIDYLKYEWICEKSKATGHLNSKKQPMKSHENVLVFYKEQCIYNPQDIIKKKIPTIRKGGDNGTNYGKSDKDAIQEYENYPKIIIYIPSQSNNFHPTQKPVALFEYLIKTYTNEGALVLDNCAGSGTTAIACENTNRNWICMEKDETYANAAIERIRKHVEDNNAKGLPDAGLRVDI